VKKTYIKYFTLFITIILLNSNFSFAISEMLCKMSEVQTECECETDPHTGIMKISSEEKGCCNINISEINNSNTLEKNNKNFNTELSLQHVIFFIPVNEFSKNYSTQSIFTNCNIPIPDIPIINSSFLI
jgi:hypothetical protein